MKYSLVLQWAPSSTLDYDRLIEIEDDLTERLPECMVDGHDLGSDEMNIFIFTDDPRQALKKIMPLLEGAQLKDDARIAYREVTGSKYTILWPDGLKVFKVT